MQNLLNRVKSVFHSRKGACWGWFGQRAHDALGIAELVPLNFIVCCDWGQDTEILSQRFKNIFSLEKNSQIRRNWSNEDINKALMRSLSEKVWQYLRNKSKTYCVCYRSIRKLEELTREQANIKLLASPLKLKDYFDDKVRARRNMCREGIDVVYGEIARLSSIRYHDLRRKYGKKLVVQLKHGSSGMNTFLAETPRCFRKIKHAHLCSRVNITKFIPRYSLNINVAILKQNNFPDIVISHPSVQLVGIKECCRKPFIYCGNDYTAAKSLKREILAKVYKITTQTAQWLEMKGFRGIFGLDLLIEKEKVYVLEVNPRFQNSTSLLSLMEIKQRRLPLVALHILEFIDERDVFGVKEAREIVATLRGALEGAQLILHNNKDSPSRIGGELLPGVYTLEGDNLKFIRRGLSILDCRNTDEFVITCSVPEKDKLVEKDAPLLKLQSLSSFLNSDLKNLNRRTKRIVKKIYDRLDLRALHSVIALLCLLRYNVKIFGFWYVV